MALPLYLAMTAEEMAYADPLPGLGASMSCHFSLYGSGLEGIPTKLPAGWMMVLSDRVPVWNHDPKLVTAQLQEAEPALVLLDFQGDHSSRVNAIIESILTLPCPVAVSQRWEQDFSCPVFLEPVPPSQSLTSYLAPWEGRDVWLDISTWGEKITVTKDGSTISPLPTTAKDGPCHREEKLRCHYQTKIFADRAEFSLFRTQEDIAALLAEAEALGVTRAVGLWTELQGLWA